MPIRKSDDLRNDCAKFKGFWPNRLQCKSYQCGAHLRGGRRAEGLTAAAAGEAAWFGGAKRAAEPGCERSERRILADARSVSARTTPLSSGGRAESREPREARIAAAVCCSDWFGELLQPLLVDPPVTVEPDEIVPHPRPITVVDPG